MNSADLNEMEFALKYDGLAVERARMSARELGPALFSAAILLERTSELLYGDKGKARVEVHADFKGGSFLVDFSILAESANHLSHLGRDDLRLILEIIGVTTGGGGLIAALKWLKGRKPDRVERDTDGKTTIFIQNSTLVLNPNESKAFFDPDVRKSLDGIVDPIRQPGIDFVQLGPGRELTNKITKDEADYFRPREESVQDISTDEIIAVLEVVSPAFRETNKWRFQYAGGTFHAAIFDERFLAKVAKSEERFGAGDALRVRARVRSISAEVGIRHEWEIVEVLDHIAGGSDQLHLMD